MTPGSTRRQFLEMTAAAAGMAGLGDTPASGLQANETPLQEPSSTPRPKIAALATVYHYLSHAYHIVGRFVDGFMVYDGNGLHKPPFDITSLFIEQTPPATDLGRAKARGHGIRLSPTIGDALALGTGKLAVDAILLIAEHGEYPYNEKQQKLYPRGRFFREVLEVFRASGRAVPVFIDKHLSYSRAEAREMVDRAEAQHVPLMAGSSLPVTWRIPPLEVPLGRSFKDVVVASRGDLEIFGFHALETLQCMVERRHRSGRTQGVSSVTCLEGDAVWEAGDKGVWSWSLLEHALGRSHTRNVGDIKQNTRDYRPPPAPAQGALSKLRHPTAFVVEYVDGLRATVLILNGHVDDTTIAARIDDAAGGDSVVSTLMHLPAPPAPASSIRSCSASKTSSARGSHPTPSNGPCSRGDPRCRPGKPDSGPSPDRDARPGHDRLPRAGRFGVHPEHPDEPGDQSILRRVGGAPEAGLMKRLPDRQTPDSTANSRAERSSRRRSRIVTSSRCGCPSRRRAVSRKGEPGRGEVSCRPARESGSLCALQLTQASTQFSQVVFPPCDRGIRWSIDSSAVPGWQPQYWQVE